MGLLRWPGGARPASARLWASFWGFLGFSSRRNAYTNMCSCTSFWCCGGACIGTPGVANVTLGTARCDLPPLSFSAAGRHLGVAPCPRTRLSPCKSQIPQRKTVDNCHTLPAEPPRYALLLSPVVLALWSPFWALSGLPNPLSRGSPVLLGSPR
jgi:hypothetical protein